MGTLTYDKSASIGISQQALFGRHCAVVGTTGGGKSYTVSKLLEGVASNNGKAILIDATGEYSTHDGNDYSDKPSKLSVDSFFHYSNLTIGDLFVLLRPSGQVQAPKLLEAIKSLKVLQILESKLDADETITRNYDGTFSILINDDTVTIDTIKTNNGIIVKNGQLMRPFNRIYNKYIRDIESIDSNFDIKALSNQIVQECIWDVDRRDSKRWGGKNENHLNNCISLILRVNNLVNNPLFDTVFGFNKEKNDENELTKQISDFLNNEKNLFRVGFEKVGFDFQAREIVANSIGKFLLEKARNGDFKRCTIDFIY